MADGVQRPARPIPRPGRGDRPVPEERRGRSELYSDLRETDAGGDQGPRSSPDGPRITDDGAWQWKGLRLEAEANRIADEELSARRTAEGRESDGSYGDHGITPAMRRVEVRLEHGTLVPDTEKFALKSPDRFKEKLAKMIESTDRTPRQRTNRRNSRWYTVHFFVRISALCQRNTERVRKLSETTGMSLPGSPISGMATNIKE